MAGIKELSSDYIFISLVAFLISVILTPMIRKSCQQHGMFDLPSSSRKIHALPVPRLGGIAIYAAFFIPLFSIFLTNRAVHEVFVYHVDTLLSLFAASTLVFAVGVYDDVRGATAWQKLFVQCLAATLVYMLGFKIEAISIPFVGGVQSGMFSFPITILWIIGVTNAINFIDGVDGLACGVGFFSVSTMFILAVYLHHTFAAFLAAALAGGIFGFALYNFAPASIFMGDSGSLFIGFAIAVISLQSSQKSSTAVILLIPIVALGVPIADTLLAIVRRLGNGHSPFVADKDHIHHRLLRMGLSTRQVTGLLYGICSLLGSIALLMTAVNNKVLTLILLILSVMMIGGMKILGYTTDMMALNEFARTRIQQKKRALERQRSAELILAEIMTAADVFIVRKMTVKYLEILEFDIGSITSASGSSEVPSRAHIATEDVFQAQHLLFRWYSPRYSEKNVGSGELWTLSLPLQTTSTSLRLVLGTSLDSASTLLEYTLLAEYLKSALEHAMLRLEKKVRGTAPPTR